MGGAVEAFALYPQSPEPGGVSDCKRRKPRAVNYCGIVNSAVIESIPSHRF
jgi:hypothetical protein